MEYVNVRFSEPRTVYINGIETGTTNGILRIGSGTQCFDLGDPKDYQPPEIVIPIFSTNPLEPLIVDFKPIQ